jgi:NTP pyrophosphatase (non-canonical NTP hydrolase)
MNLEKVVPKILKQNQEIELFSDDDIYSVVQMIICEVLELAEATENAFLTDDLTAVVSESADCLYLLIRLFDVLGIDERALELKLVRNQLKYFGKESKEQAIEDWRLNGGDEAFFEMYIDKFGK